MREFIKFMLGGYWNDADSNDAGGRGVLIFCWLMVWVVVQSLAIIAVGITRTI